MTNAMCGRLGEQWTLQSERSFISVIALLASAHEVSVALAICLIELGGFLRSEDLLRLHRDFPATLGQLAVLHDAFPLPEHMQAGWAGHLGGEPARHALDAVNSAHVNGKLGFRVEGSSALSAVGGNTNDSHLLCRSPCIDNIEARRRCGICKRGLERCLG